MENQIKALEFLIKELLSSYSKKNVLFLDDTYNVPAEGFINVEREGVRYYIPSEGFHDFKDKYSEELKYFDNALDLYAFCSHWLVKAYHANRELFDVGLGVLFEWFGCAFWIIKNEEANNA